MRQKPKILRIINRFNLGGPTYNVAYLTKYLEDEFETLLIGGEKEESESSSEFILEKLGLKPLLISEMQRELGILNDYRAYKKIRKIIRDYKPDIVHTHASKAGAVGRMAAIHEKVPVIVHTFHGHVFHSYFGRIKTWIFKVIERYLAYKSSAIVAISDIQKKELCEQFKIADKNKTTVINLGFDLTRFKINREELRAKFRDEFLIEKDEFVVSIIGRLAPVKNHALFLNAISRITDKIGKKVRFIIVGDGELRDNLLHQCEVLNLNYAYFPQNPRVAQVLFTSWITDVERALAGSDLVCLTSNNEGTPVSLIEAQAAGKAILSTQVGGIKDIVHPDAAILVKPGDEQSFSEALLKLILNPGECSEMGRAGDDFVMKRFGYERLVREMAQLYNRLLQG